MNNKMLDNETIKRVGSDVGRIIEGDLIPESFAYIQKLEVAVEQNKEVLARDFRAKSTYSKYILMLKYIVLPKLDNTEIIGMLKANLLLVREIYDYDLYYKLKEKMFSLDAQVDVDDFRKQAQNALQVNNEMISDKKIIVDGGEQMPSVANWLKDYNSVCLSEEFSDTCLEEYFSSNMNIADLPEQKQDLIKKIIILFENLKRPIKFIGAQGESITVILPDGGMGRYQNGKVVKITQDNSIEEEYKISDTEKQAIENAFNPVVDSVEEIDVDSVSVSEKKKEILEYFRENIFTENYSNSSVEEAANVIILSILVEDLNFKIEIEKTLYQNLVKITHKNFVLGKKAQAPSIKNWLRYFIEKMGSSMFNNLELSKFISESENARDLDDKEKKVLNKLLRTYRNIKFFPQSMGNLPIEKWEIIPLERKEVRSRASQVEHIQKTGRDALIDELQGNIDDYADGSLEKEVLAEESANDQERHKLLLLAKKYPEGSLERRAVEDEIAKLEK